MGNAFLRLFGIETLITFVVGYLASTVKNPGSQEAIKLRYAVTKLRDAADNFLKQVY